MHDFYREDPAKSSEAPVSREAQPIIREHKVKYPKKAPTIAPPSPGIAQQSRKRTKTPAKKPRSALVWWMIYALYLGSTVAYFSFFAKDRYVSTARFAVIRGGDTASNGDDALSFITGSTQGQQDAYTAIAHLESVDMFRWIEESPDLNFREHFIDADYDIFHHLKPGAHLEDALEFYQDRVTAALDDVEGLVTVEVDAFTPAFAQELCSAILTRTEDYLNQLNRDIADKSAVFLVEDLETSEGKLEAARQALIAFQNDNLTVDPSADVQARLELIQSLKKQKVFNQAEQMRLQAESPKSPHIAVLESQITAMESEMARESEALTGEGPNQLNRLLATYSKLSQDLEFATGRYLQNLQIVESIRLQTLSQHRYLSVVQNPFLPEDAVKPERLYWCATFAILGLLGMQIVRLSFRTISDHG